MTETNSISADFRKALRTLITACGGPKRVGTVLRPGMTPAAAGQWLLKAINADERERLDLEDVLVLLRLGHDKGHHGAMHALADAALYTHPSPVEPENRRAALQREFIEASKQMQAIARKLGRLDP